MHAQSRNLPLTSRHIEFNGKQRVTFRTQRNNNLQLLVWSADTARRIVRVRENQVEEFIRAYKAGGTSMTTITTMTTNAKFVNEVNDGFYICLKHSEPTRGRFEVFLLLGTQRIVTHTIYIQSRPKCRLTQQYSVRRPVCS